MHRPLIIAHSGFDGTAPNSLVTAGTARKAGVDAVEFDIQCSGDGVPIVTHDDYLVTESGERRRIASVPACAVADGTFRVPGRDGCPPTLLEVIAACHACDLILNLDVKDMRALPAIRETVRDTRFTGRTVITGCRLAELYAEGRPDYGVPCVANIAPPPDDVVARGVRSERTDRWLDATLELAVAVGVQGINMEHSRINETIVDAAHRRFLSVAVWTVTRRRRFDRLQSLGVDSITLLRSDIVTNCRSRS